MNNSIYILLFITISVSVCEINHHHVWLIVKLIRFTFSVECIEFMHDAWGTPGEMFFRLADLMMLGNSLGLVPWWQPNRQPYLLMNDLSLRALLSCAKHPGGSHNLSPHLLFQGFEKVTKCSKKGIFSIWHRIAAIPLC